MKNSELSYYLLDGAALHEQPQHLEAAVKLCPVCLYEEYGEKAAHIGPLLLPASKAAQTLFQQINAEKPMLFAASELHVVADQSASRLIEHLKSIAFISVKEGNRYFLRYADTRVYGNLWETLTEPQKYRLMGPIKYWTSLGRDGSPQAYQATICRVETGEITLSSTQSRALRRLEEPDALLKQCPTSQVVPLLTEHGDAKVWQWMRTLCEQLQELKIAHPAVRTAAAEAVLESCGTALSRPEFNRSLLISSENASPLVIDAWRQTRNKP